MSEPIELGQPRIDDDTDVFPSLEVEIRCPLCDQVVLTECTVIVRTDHDATFGTNLKASLSGTAQHSCPNVTVPTP